MTSSLHTSAGSGAVGVETRHRTSTDLLRWIGKAVKADPALRNNRELMRWAAVLPYIHHDQEHLLEAADFAIKMAVLRRRGEWRRGGAFGQWRLRRSVERNVQTRCPAFYLVRGLFILIVLAGLAVLGTWEAVDSRNELLGLDSKHLALVAVAGVMGSIVSLLTRVPEFATQRNASRFVLEAIGFCKPLIGTAFALFGYALLQADVIPLRSGLATTPSIIAVLGFVAAFSERFIPDMIFRTEGQLGGGRRRRGGAPAPRRVPPRAAALPDAP